MSSSGWAFIRHLLPKVVVEGKGEMHTHSRSALFLRFACHLTNRKDLKQVGLPFRLSRVKYILPDYLAKRYIGIGIGKDYGPADATGGRGPYPSQIGFVPRRKGRL